LTEFDRPGPAHPVQVHRPVIGTAPI